MAEPGVPVRAWGRTWRRDLLALAIAAALARGGCSRGSEDEKRVQASLQSALTSTLTRRRTSPPTPKARSCGSSRSNSTSDASTRQRGSMARSRMPQMAELIDRAHERHPRRARPAAVQRRLARTAAPGGEQGLPHKKGFDPDEAGALDVWLTYLYMKYASDLADGLSDLAHADPTWQIKTEKFDAAATPRGRAGEEHRRASLLELDAGRTRSTRRCARCSPTTARMAAKGGWPAVPAHVEAEARTEEPAVATRRRAARRLRRLHRLRARGRTPRRLRGRAAGSGQALPAPPRPGRRRHGRRRRVAEMNVPIEQRIRQIELNLERWRWLPRDLGDRHILVNIPEIPARSLGWRPGAAHDARRRRQAGHADADLQRRDDLPGVQSVLERAARHRAGRNAARGPEGSRLPRADQHGSARHERQAGRSGVDRSRRSRPVPVPPAARRARTRSAS